MAQQDGKTGKQGKAKASRGKAKDLGVSQSKEGAKGGALNLATTALKTNLVPPNPLIPAAGINPDPLSKVTLNPQPLPPR